MTMISKKFPAAALIDGEWVTSAKTFSVTDPATGAEVAAVPDLGAGGRCPRHRRSCPRAAVLVRQDRERARHHPQALVRSHHRRDRDPRPIDDDRAGQAACRGACRGWLWRFLHRVVCRGGEAGLRADDPDHGRFQALPHHQAADRRRRGHRAVELPDRHDHAEGRARARFRVHHRGQARGGDAALRAGARQAWDGRRAPAWRAQHRHHHGCVCRRQGLLRRRRACASCPSPGRPRSARCSTGNAPIR